jgi:hypothetical protein
VYTQTGISALRSIGTNVVVTVLTCKLSDFAFILDMAVFRGKVTPSIAVAWTGDHAQLTGRNGLVLVIIASNVGDKACAPIGL